MPDWVIWSVVALALWLVIGLAAALLFGRIVGIFGPREDAVEGPAGNRSLRPPPVRTAPARSTPPPPVSAAARASRRRILLVDDDAGLRLLLRTTLAADDCAVEEAASAEEARELARFWRPSLVVLDVNLPGTSGLAFSAELAEKTVYGAPRVVLLTADEVSSAQASAASADALLRKPFSPLDLLATVDRVLEGKPLPHVPAEEATSSDQLLAYAEDLGRLVQTERAQRQRLQYAYRQTVTAFTDALEARSHVTGRHAMRVHAYAVELTEAVEPDLLDDPSYEYGFLLHDIGKIGIPDSVLDKPGPLNAEERRLMQQHPLIGAELLAGVPLLDGEGLQVVRSHHERWDGRGYPDGLAGETIPPVARIFAVADALDAMTSERPYRQALSWEDAVDEIVRNSGTQFDPGVVGAFALREQRLHRTQHDLVRIA
jgi:ribonuclease P protein subunit RPR2